MTAGATRVVDAFVGLGSNLADPVKQVEDAFSALEDLPATELAARSPLYRSEPIGPPGQPDYVNAVAQLQTGLSAEALLAGLQTIELRQGRERAERWGPRTLDLDLLVFGDAVIATPSLTVPHPHLAARAFVLLPLFDVAPGLTVPGLGDVAALLRAVDVSGVALLGETTHG